MKTKTIDADRELKNVQELVTAVAGRILQVSDRKAGVALGAATNALVGSSLAASTMAAVASLGTAGTGAAIAGLSGAAKTTATLYWIGGLVGGGVAAGTVVLGAGAIGAGIYGSIKVRRALLGHAREPEKLSEEEQRILQAAQALVASLQATVEQEKVSQAELAMFSRIGIDPFVGAVEHALSQCLFNKLNTYNRARLRGHIVNLKKAQSRLEPI